MNRTSSFKIEFALRCLLAVATFTSLIFFFSPSWAAFKYGTQISELSDLIQVRRGLAVVGQMQNPGAKIPDQLHAAIQWRLFFPVVGKVLKLSPPWMFSLAPLGCILLLAYIINLLREFKLNWSNCWLASLSLGSASWFFTSTGWLGYYDSWLALGLVLVTFAEKRWIVWLTCALTPWIDERFIIAAPLAFLCRWLFARAQPTKAALFTWLRRNVLIAAFILGAFVIVRLGILTKYSANEATMKGYMAVQNYLNAPTSRILLGIFEGFRLGWLYIFGAVVFLRRNPVLAAMFVGLVIITASVGLYTAQDYSRSMTMLLPAGLYGLLSMVRQQASWLPLALRLSAVCAVALPAYHVMNDRTEPIYSLYHELSFLSTPPSYAMPEVHEIQGIQAIERGLYAEAEYEFTLAVKLSENPSSPLLQRGQLYANGQRWPDAFNDFSKAIEYAPQSPESWFMRAQANYAMGFPEDANKDLEKALEVGSKDWSTRPDVARFRANINKPKRTPQ